MSFLRHTSCNSCGSSDARAVYDDGSEHCFSCSNHKGPELRYRLNPKVKKDKIASHVFSINSIPEDAMKWLDKYDLTVKEKSLFRWVPEKEALVYETHNFWTGRTFSEDKDIPRYQSSGMKPFSVMGQGETLVLVEDIVSGLKVSRHTSCCVLFGSSIPDKVIAEFAMTFNKIVVWLDRDKAKQSIGLSHRLRAWGIAASSIITLLDPKDYSDGELIEGLNIGGTH